MKVRVFIPSDAATEREVFVGTDHNFPALPAAGQPLRFTDHRRGDFVVTNVGYVQDLDAFMPALWLRRSDPQLAYGELPETAPAPEYRDLNHDVPPESMTSY